MQKKFFRIRFQNTCLLFVEAHKANQACNGNYLNFLAQRKKDHVKILNLTEPMKPTMNVVIISLARRTFWNISMPKGYYMKTDAKNKSISESGFKPHVSFSSNPMEPTKHVMDVN